MVDILRNTQLNAARIISVEQWFGSNGQTLNVPGQDFVKSKVDKTTFQL